MATRTGDVTTYKSKTRRYQDDARAKEAAFNDIGTQAGLLGTTVLDTVNIAEDWKPKEKEVEESPLGRDNVLKDYNEDTGLFDVETADEAALRVADDKALPGKLADLDDYNALTEDSYTQKGVKIAGENVELGYNNSTSLIEAYEKNPVVEKTVENPYVLVDYNGISNAASKILSGDTIEGGSHGGYAGIENKTKWQTQKEKGGLFPNLKRNMLNATNTRFSEYYNNPNYEWDPNNGWVEVE